MFNIRVLGLNISHDVLVEELQYKRNTVCKHQVLGHELELVDVVQFEVFE